MQSVIKLYNNKIIRIMIIICMSLLAAVSVFQGIRNAMAVSQDFQWDATRALLVKEDPYEMSMNSGIEIKDDRLVQFYKLFTDAGLKQKMEANQFPSLLLLLAPYAVLPPLLARYAWIISNLIFTIAIAWLLRRTFLKKLALFDFLFVVLLMLIGTPYRNQLGVGQHTLFSFAFFLLAVFLDDKKPDGNSAGISFCCFVSFFKYTLTAPLSLYLLYRRRFREFIIAILGHVVLTIFSAIWLQKSFVYMLTAPLKVSSVLSAEGGIDVGAIVNGGIPAYILGAAIGIMLLVITFMLPKGKEEVIFVLLLVWSLVITYHRTYDFFVLSSISISAFLCKLDGGYINTEEDGKYGNNIFGIKGLGRVLQALYMAVILGVYFVLRIFNENTSSKIIIGILYYVFAVLITIMSVKMIRKNMIKNGHERKE